MKTKKIIVPLFGAPGAGKGCQTGLYKTVFPDFMILSMSGLLRGSKDPVIRQIMASGNLVSDRITHRCLTNAINSAEVAVTDRVFIDGAPRTRVQARNLLRQFTGHLFVPIEFALSDEQCLQRLAKRAQEAFDAGEEVRADDRPDIWKERVRIYRQAIPSIQKTFHTLRNRSFAKGDRSVYPHRVADWYAINATQEPKEIADQVAEHIGTCLDHWQKHAHDANVFLSPFGVE